MKTVIVGNQSSPNKKRREKKSMWINIGFTIKSMNHYDYTCWNVYTQVMSLAIIYIFHIFDAPLIKSELFYSIICYLLKVVCQIVVTFITKSLRLTVWTKVYFFLFSWFLDLYYAAKNAIQCCVVFCFAYTIKCETKRNIEPVIIKLPIIVYSFDWELICTHTHTHIFVWYEHDHVRFH